MNKPLGERFMTFRGKTYYHEEDVLSALKGFNSVLEEKKRYYSDEPDMVRRLSKLQIEFFEWFPVLRTKEAEK